MKRIYGIDGLRAIAVLFTVIQHYIISYYFRSESILGSLGVSIFFVISGFLITSILLKQKQENVSNKEKFIKFYTRRSLRIFPIYYLTISICILSGLYWFRNINPFWYYGYAINIFIAIQNNGWIGYAGHLWSLAVEEQFYLVWPIYIYIYWLFITFYSTNDSFRGDIIICSTFCSFSSFGNRSFIGILS